LHSAQGTKEGARLSLLLAGNLRRAAPSFAMICLGEVGQLEVDGESFGHPMRVTDIETADYKRHRSSAHRRTAELHYSLILTLPPPSTIVGVALSGAFNWLS
jgi:hypothetical protein